MNSSFVIPLARMAACRTWRSGPSTCSKSGGALDIVFKKRSASAEPSPVRWACFTPASRTAVKRSKAPILTHTMAYSETAESDNPPLFRRYLASLVYRLRSADPAGDTDRMAKATYNAVTGKGSPSTSEGSPATVTSFSFGSEEGAVGIRKPRDLRFSGTSGVGRVLGSADNFHVAPPLVRN